MVTLFDHFENKRLIFTYHNNTNNNIVTIVTLCTVCLLEDDQKLSLNELKLINSFRGHGNIFCSNLTMPCKMLIQFIIL